MAEPWPVPVSMGRYGSGTSLAGTFCRPFSTENANWDVAFSPDGAYLYASDRNGGLHVYALELETLVSLAHERLTRWFTPEECLQYLHQETCPEKPAAVR
jgi:hypothetical protein